MAAPHPGAGDRSTAAASVGAAASRAQPNAARRLATGAMPRAGTHSRVLGAQSSVRAAQRAPKAARAPAHVVLHYLSLHHLSKLAKVLPELVCSAEGGGGRAHGQVRRRVPVWGRQQRVGWRRRGGGAACDRGSGADGLPGLLRPAACPWGEGRWGPAPTAHVLWCLAKGRPQTPCAPWASSPAAPTSWHQSAPGEQSSGGWADQGNAPALPQLKLAQAGVARGARGAAAAHLPPVNHMDILHHRVCCCWLGERHESKSTWPARLTVAHHDLQGDRGPVGALGLAHWAILADGRPSTHRLDYRTILGEVVAKLFCREREEQGLRPSRLW